MKTFLLLILSLITGSSEESEVKACEGGWVEFTCKYPERSGKYEHIDLVYPDKTTIRSTQMDVWESKNNIHLYHDTKNEALRVSITQLQKNNFGKYKCKFYKGPNSYDEEYEQDVELKHEDGCQRQFIETAYKPAQTTITCDYSGNKSSRVQFFCKENGFICEDILSTESSLKSNGTFSLTETSRGFSVSISNVSSHHAAVYWCGVKPKAGSYRAALRKIQLEVEDITIFERSPAVGQTFTYWCKYTTGSYTNKFICKGEDPSRCELLLNSTALPSEDTGRFSMTEDTANKNITITVRDVRTDDTGTYWCGAKSSKTPRNKFFHRFLMTVVSPASPPSPVSPTRSGTTSSERHDETTGGSQLVVIVIVCVAVLLLLFVLTSILVYKRFSRSKNTQNEGTSEHVQEDYVYEEIQERVQKPDSGNAMNTIYATANFPSDPSASLHYSTINFQSGSDKAGGEALLVKPSSSACEYSAVKKSPTYWTVHQPSRSSEGPLYSTVNRSQQQ